MQDPIVKGRLHVHLMHMKIQLGGKGKYKADRLDPHNLGKGFMVIWALDLIESLGHEARLVAIHIAVAVQF